MTHTLELCDLQGLLLYGYGNHPYAAYLFVRVGDRTRAKDWLAAFAPRVTHADADTKRRTSLNVAFTHTGLQLLADEPGLSGFSREFVEGMVTPHRQRILGDLTGSPNDPANWLWGAPGQDRIDALVLLFAEDPAVLNALVDEERSKLTQADLTVVHAVRSSPLKDAREHFGFRDGIANPKIHKDQTEADTGNHVRAGEVVLGYANQSGVLPTSPFMCPDTSTHWGDNGSYLVFRQLAQDVGRFWRDAAACSDAMGPPGTRLSPVHLASKMMGRWPNGSPLTVSPEAPPATVDEGALDSFGYVSHGDRDGLGCPHGAHIRRANPRDALGESPSDSVSRVKSRRIARRGRTYGPPYEGEEVPSEARTTDMAGAGPSTSDMASDQERGILFICLNANIGTQFEFVQQTWLNSRKFNHATDSVDPIAGAPARPGALSTFCVQKQPVHHRVPAWSAPVSVRGGAYFFMPGLRSLVQLAQ